MTISIENAELKTIRGALGLSTSWFAEQLNVGKRTLQFWESSDPTKKIQVPSDVIDFLLELVELSESIIKRMVFENTNSTDEVILIRYVTDEELWKRESKLAKYKLPVSYFGNILYQVKKDLNDKGIKTKIVYSSKANLINDSYSI